MKTKKAAASTRKVRKEHPGSDGPRRYTLRSTHYEISEFYGESYPPDESDPFLRAYGIRTHEPRRLEEAPFSAQGGIRTPGALYPKGRGADSPLANRAQPARPELTFIPQTKRSRAENAFKKRRATGQAGCSRHKVSLPQEFVEWAERQGFAPAAAARFVLAWFCERESVDKSAKVQYTCPNRTWPTNAPRTKKM